MRLRRLFYDYSERINHRDTLKILSEMKSHDQYTRCELDQYINKKIWFLLNDSYENVPFYRDNFDNLKLPKYVDEATDVLNEWPVIKRNDFQKSAFKFVSYIVNRSDLRRLKSGGSTGNPVFTYQIPHIAEMGRASKLRARSWYGISEVPKIFMLWGSSGGFDGSLSGKIKNKIRLVSYKFTGIYHYSAYNLGPKEIKSCIDELQKCNPELVYAYTSSIYNVAQYILKNKIKIKLPELKLINVTAEPLYKFQKITLENAFKVSVQNGYGAGEVTNIAFSCPEGGFHLVEDNTYVELLDDNNVRSVEGRVVVTALHSVGTPIIRYEIGDLARFNKKSCYCDLPYKLLENVNGRQHDEIKLPSGAIIHGELFTHSIEQIKGINRFQVLQVKPAEFNILLESDNTVDIEYNKQIQKLKEKINEPITVTVNIVDEIENDPSAKFRWIKSLVKND